MLFIEKLKDKLKKLNGFMKIKSNYLYYVEILKEILKQKAFLAYFYFLNLYGKKELRINAVYSLI